MRTFLLAAAALTALGSPATAASRNFGITAFEKVRIEGPYKVRLATGVAPFASASGSLAIGLSASAMSAFVAIMQVGMWCGYVTFGFVSDRFGRRR